ncbi:MAG TPA: S8 family serine peptidase [Acidimicrobiales bacterium]|nr:S8 family serine peptidase [Acidimicrobiales bacterium]
MAGTTPTGEWSERVAFANAAGEPFAYRPNEIVVAGEQARDFALEVTGFEADVEEVFPEEGFGADARRPVLFRVRAEFDPVELSADLRLRGMVGQPNHVLFAHCGCCCRPHPADRGVAGSPVYASPVYASPVYASEYQATGHRKSSARPASEPAYLTVPASSPRPEGGRAPRVVVLDTGLAAGALRPACVGAVSCAAGDCDEPDEDGDHLLDPAAGHGTFIAGLIALLAPGCDLTVERVLTTFGDGDEVTIARAIAALDPDTDILNLSFGGYAMERMDVLAAAIRIVQKRATVVVASAGNDATCRPAYPAALPGVIGVGAVGPDGPARFSNYGPWVRACAPGVDLVSAFFTVFDGAGTAPAGTADPDRFREWACWSGTSFAAPVVAAALAREMRLTGVGAADAVARVVDAPGLLRLADLGTVVNLL